MIPLFRERVAARTDWSRDAHDDGIEDLMSRVVDELRSIRGSMPQAELDAMAHDIVLDVARFVLRWAEGAGEDAALDLTRRRLALAGSPERLAI
ncbi:MAG TPA: hypothetical protein VFZ11_00410 [Gemmatimonadaceae bacterium]